MCQCLDATPTTFPEGVASSAPLNKGKQEALWQKLVVADTVAQPY
jgi:hypothetical protein